jgi:predicted RNA-binding Zn-ribbon protein involved in translation (DUF1610 family)
MLVCEQGHMITSMLKSHPEDAVKRCPECGAQTISKCPKCNTDIKGYEHIPGVGHMGPRNPPSFCHECGTPYPWASKKEVIEKQKDHGFAKNRIIFIAHSFCEDKLIKGLKVYIEQQGFKWVEGKREDLGSISEDILRKIRESGFFIAVMTKEDELKKGNFTTSSWLIEEKGAALAFGHRPLIMVESGVDRHYVGFLQNDDQLVYFERDEFAQKMIDAVNMIKGTLEKIKK